MSSKANLMVTYALLVFIWSTTPLAIVWSVYRFTYAVGFGITFFHCVAFGDLFVIGLKSDNFPHR